MANARNANYTSSEDTLLCDSYKQICQDPIIGRYQPANQLYARVLEKFVSDGGTPRPQRSIESRIGVIKRAMAKMIACVAQIESLNPSGASESDIVSNCSIFMS